MTPETIAKKRAARRCIAPFCTRLTGPKQPLCPRCRQRVYREAQPIRYLFNNLRNNALRRGKAFCLTIDEFADFCARTQYHVLKGRTAGDYHIDRIRPWDGYQADNIRMLTCSLNSARGDADPTPEEYAEAFAPAESAF